MGDLDHRRVQQLAQRLSGQNRCARSFKPAPRCHLATRMGLLVHLDRRAKPTIERAARCDADSGQLIQERATCMEGPRSLPKCRRRRAALRGGCFTGFIPLSLGAVRAGKGGTRVVHDGGVDGIVFDAARLSTGRVDGAVWCSRG